VRVLRILRLLRVTLIFTGESMVIEVAMETIRRLNFSITIGAVLVLTILTSAYTVYYRRYSRDSKQK